MRLWLVLAAVAAIAGCGPPTYTEPWPDPVELPPSLPLVVTRIPVDFTFIDYPTGKQYRVRRYTSRMDRDDIRGDRLGGAEGTSITTIAEPADMRLEVVTVVDREAGDERLATAIEKAYALGALQSDWVSKRQEDALAFHRDAVARERAMRDDLLDDRIFYHAHVLAELQEEKFRMESDLAATQTTDGYKAPDGRVDFLTIEIGRHALKIAERQATLDLLKVAKYQRDTQHARSSRPVIIREYLRVDDLVRGDVSPDRIISEITQAVRPESWKEAGRAIRHTGGYLEVANSRSVIAAVEDHLETMRARRQQR